MLDSLGGAVGVTVTVRTCPVIVSSDMIGVGVQLELVVSARVVCWAATVVCCIVGVVVEVSEVLVEEVVFVVDEVDDVAAPFVPDGDSPNAI